MPDVQAATAAYLSQHDLQDAVNHAIISLCGCEELPQEPLLYLADRLDEYQRSYKAAPPPTTPQLDRPTRHELGGEVFERWRCVSSFRGERLPSPRAPPLPPRAAAPAAEGSTAAQADEAEAEEGEEGKVEEVAEVAAAEAEGEGGEKEDVVQGEGEAGEARAVEAGEGSIAPRVGAAGGQPLADALAWIAATPHLQRRLQILASVVLAVLAGGTVLRVLKRRK
ncbi:hypothetical protein AB1Y20_014118 [Prymnesium parvum]